MKFETKTKSLMYGMELTHGIRRALLSALGLLYFLSFGFSLISVTALFSISTLIMMFFEFPTAAIADFDSRKKSLLISFFLMFVAFFGLFIFRNFWLLAFSWILTDVAWTFCSGANYAWAIDNLNYAKKHSKLLPFLSKSYSFEKTGRAIGGLIGLVIILLNFRFVWLFISLSYLLFLIIFWRYSEERNFIPTKTPHNFIIKSFKKAKEVFIYLFKRDNHKLRRLTFIDMLVVFASSAFFVCLPLKLSEFFGLTSGAVSGIYAVLAFFAIAGSLVVQRLKYFKIFNLLYLCVLLVGIVTILFGFSSNLTLALFFVAAGWIFSSTYVVLIDSASHSLFSSEIRASLGSMTNILWAISSAISVFLAGLSVSFIGLNETIIICGLIFVFSAFLFLFKFGGKK